MSQSLIKKPYQLKYIDVAIPGNITFSGYGVANINSYKPSGKTILFATAVVPWGHWNEGSPGAVCAAGYGDYLNGPPNAVIDGTIVRYFYTD